MWVLALETSTSIGSVAVRAPGAETTSIALDVAGRHGDVLLPAVRDCLHRAGRSLRDMTLLAAGVGPGSFTGVRSALAVAKGLAIASGLPLLGVGSLDALAARVLSRAPAGATLAALDARRGELFAALFAPDGRSLLGPRVGPPSRIAAEVAAALAPGEAVTLIGNVLADAALTGALVEGLRAYAVTLGEAVVPAAEHVAALAALRFARGQQDDRAALDACYVRPPDARLPPPPRWGLAADGAGSRRDGAT